MDAEVQKIMMHPEADKISDQAEEIFLNALEQQDASQQASYLEKACGTDHLLRDTVQTLLEDYNKASEFFKVSSMHLSVPANIFADDELDPGAMIGPYRIVGPLGEGGSSKVYEAEQDAPVRRRVALKILKLGMDTAAVISRFEEEKQTLARLEHPNISRVIDAGATQTGRPYFVMELVHGTRITDYCEKNELSTESRVQLMCQLCSALQHAHNKGIIHRDIKPSNILVAVVDGLPVPKLIDFGIAKATDTDSGNERTMLGQPIGTPAYMSPEQIDGRTRDVDTRSDIYSLGVVLYELLAGHPPFIIKNGETASGIEDMRRRILHEIPRIPSQANKGRENRPKEELDWIVMKALEKDREQRYSTAHAFASDLESYLKHEPVTAHPPSSVYRLKKLLFRNRLASASITVAVGALITGFTVSTFLYLRAHAAEMEQKSLREAAEERAHITKAAIFIMEDRPEQADEEIRRMGGQLTQPSVEAMNVFRTLAIWSAKNGDWKTSADRWLAMAQVSHFDEYDTTDKATRDLLPIAPTLVMTYDFARYSEFREFLIRKIGNTAYPFAAEHLLKLCLLTPASPELLNRLKHAAAVAEKSMSENEKAAPTEWMEAWRCVALGLWYYRGGHPDKAISWCSRSLLRHDWEESRQAQALLIRSMARKSVGDTEGAVKDLEKARTSVKQHIQQPLDQMKDGYFHDWLNALILLNETERVVLEAR